MDKSAKQQSNDSLRVAPAFEIPFSPSKDFLSQEWERKDKEVPSLLEGTFNLADETGSLKSD